MDVNGAKALQRRLGSHRVVETPSPGVITVPDDAPPVYRWFGVAAKGAAAGAETPAEPVETAGRRGSWRRRLGLDVR